MVLVILSLIHNLSIDQVGHPFIFLLQLQHHPLQMRNISLQPLVVVLKIYSQVVLRMKLLLSCRQQFLHSNFMATQLLELLLQLVVLLVFVWKLKLHAVTQLIKRLL